ncbi:AMP-binding protein [Jongsikchunia kroppenstedtii]|uniref:AMP-binding protein n=1 Tax=Jongsikchunia kroppenstedtii TaxID=1121721 RepID=UPI00036DDBDD|nr:AMP-binding protein [Jongsikchunia kroppenstedtii]
MKPGDTPDNSQRRTDIASLFLDRLGDQKLGLRTRDAQWTWDEVVREAARRGALGKTLLTDGPKHIGVLLDNVPEFAFWLGGAALTGATIVGINPTRDDVTMAEEIAHTDCQIIVTDTAGAERVRALDTPANVLNVDDPAYLQSLPEDVDPRELDAGSGDLGGSLYLLLFTSGTTGRSKAVICTQRRLAMVAYAAIDKFGHVPDDVDYCCMPMFHGNALMALWFPALANGATICQTPKFSASGFLSDIRFFDATFFTYVGKAIAHILATPQAADDADNTLARGFGTEASPEDQARFAERFGAVLSEGYGSSEGGVMAEKVDDAPEGALGRPLPGVAIVDPETKEDRAVARLDANGLVLNAEEAIGEMVDKYASAKFEGYYKNEAADAERLRGGWYWSGDLGYIDEAGFLYFAGRRGDWVRVDSENTSTLVTERVLRRHPKVLAAAAYGEPDPRSGDMLMAAIEVADPAGFDAAEFAEFVNAQADLGRKGAPRLVRVSAALPMTGSNKVIKTQLRDEGWDTHERILQWVGRAPVTYREFDAQARAELVGEFDTHNRSRLLRQTT